MFRSIVTVNVQETGYHTLEKNRITVFGCEIRTRCAAETKYWTAKNTIEEIALLNEVKNTLESFDPQTTLIITYDGKEYDFKVLTTRAMILGINLSDLLSFQHIDIYDFLKKNTRLGVTNVFDVAYVLQCESVKDAKKKEDLKMISSAALAVAGDWEKLVEYNNIMLSVIYEIFQKIRNFIFPEFKIDLLELETSQEGIFG